MSLKEDKMEVVEESQGVDTNLYSRQLYVMGFDAQRKMAASDVLLVGLNGLGVEIAKNVILAGVRSVTLLDDAPVQPVDLASQFYCTEADVGKSRAEVSAPKLSELNPYVPIRVATGPLTNELASAFRVVVLIDVPVSLQRDIADYCHDHEIYVIIADVYGVFGNVFCDFGSAFSVCDVDGEAVASCLVASITQDCPALVHALEETRHHLSTGDIIEINGLTGMEELNGRQFKVTVKNPNSFEIDEDTSSMSAYKVGGYVKEVKQPTVLSFSKFSDSLINPGEFICDFMKIDRAGPLHFGFRFYNCFSGTYIALSCNLDLCVSHSQGFERIHTALSRTSASETRKSGRCRICVPYCYGVEFPSEC